ncbi:MAG: ABC transporter ATP-binding protein [Thaumarchaeota archaeon]|nr:ABC transporter ATP-binding protein [Nitrososphaerota archaeon]
MSDRPLLRIIGLSVVYGQVKALDNVSLTIPSSGYTLGIVGESGSGKTTLAMSVMNSLEGVGRIAGGSIEFNGRNLLQMSKNELREYRWSEVSIVYQSAMNSLNPVMTVLDPIVEVLRVHGKVPKKEARVQAVKLLSEVGIDEKRKDSYPHEFSGGMRQRVVIALALALSPKLLIADEPGSALDVVVQQKIMTLLRKQVKQKHLSLIFITHEISLLSGFVDHVAVMYRGEIVEIGQESKTLFEPLHPYTEFLISSVLDFKSKREDLLNYQLVSNPGPHGESGCKYANRCKYVFSKCLTERPLLLEAENGRWVACHKYH